MSTQYISIKECKLCVKERVSKELSKVDSKILNSIKKWLNDVILKHNNNISHNGILKSNRKEQLYKKRFGKYRLIFYLKTEEKTVEVFLLGNRNNVYDRARQKN